MCAIVLFKPDIYNLLYDLDCVLFIQGNSNYYHSQLLSHCIGLSKLLLHLICAKQHLQLRL